MIFESSSTHKLVVQYSVIYWPYELPMSARTCTQPRSEVATVSVTCGQVPEPISGRGRCVRGSWHLQTAHASHHCYLWRCTGEHTTLSKLSHSMRARSSRSLGTQTALCKLGNPLICLYACTEGVPAITVQAAVPRNNMRVAYLATPPCAVDYLRR